MKVQIRRRLWFSAKPSVRIIHDERWTGAVSLSSFPFVRTRHMSFVSQMDGFSLLSGARQHHAIRAPHRWVPRAQLIRLERRVFVDHVSLLQAHHEVEHRAASPLRLHHAHTRLEAVLPRPGLTMREHLVTRKSSALGEQRPAAGVERSTRPSVAMKKLGSK